MRGGVESQYISVYIDDIDAQLSARARRGAQIATALREHVSGRTHRAYEAPTRAADAGASSS